MSSVFRCKAVVLGGRSVGKDSILNCLLGYPNPFSKRYYLTKGVTIVSKAVKVSDADGEIVEIYFYNFSGICSVYGDLMRKLWSNEVSMVVGVFDLSREESFQYLQTIISEFLKQAQSRKESVVGIILGNKCDLSEQRIVMAEDASQWAKKVRMRYFDCSAKDNIAVQEAFLHLAKSWFDMFRS